MKHSFSRRRMLVALSVLAVFSCPARADETPLKADNVLVVTLDGLRWQEVFRGADDTLLDSPGVRERAALKRRYGQGKPVERRAALMPFLWGSLAKRGQIFGNPARRAAARCTNDQKFSYPGYSEIFCGHADPRINSNAKRDNPNLSVLEFLNNRPAFRGRVEAVCTWDVFPSIFRVKQSGLPVQAGWEPIRGERLTEWERQANEFLERLPRHAPDNVYDAFTMAAARSAVERRKPRVLYVGLGETDEWGHAGRYDLYLDAAHQADRWLAATWEALQKMPQYRDRTALVVTTDHGRGSTRQDWTDHGKNVTGAEFIWIAVMGPAIPSLGERADVVVTQSQVAATIGRLVGEDFQAVSKNAADPLPVFAPRGRRP